MTTPTTAGAGSPDTTGVVVRDLVVELVHEGYPVRILDGLSFDAARSELVVVLGPSGSGKTTLLSCLGGILSPTSGTVAVEGRDVAALRGEDLDRYRRDDVGFVFQAFNLIPSLTAVENVAIPLMLAGTSRRDAMLRAGDVLATMGLADRRTHRPTSLSGGQMQRVAIARGLAADPPLLLADEPTANLDHVQAEGIIRILRELRDDGRTIVVATHDARLVPVADRIVEMVTTTHAPDGPPRPVSLEAGQVLFDQGDPSDLVYTITSGEVDIVRRLVDGGEQHLARLGPGQYFGELGPILGFPRSAAARAVGAVELRAWGAASFRREILGE